VHPSLGEVRQVLRGVRAWEPLLMLGAEQVIDAARAWSHAAGAMEQLDIAQYGAPRRMAGNCAACGGQGG
jgi:hypothetical protein